MKTVTWKWLS